MSEPCEAAGPGLSWAVRFAHSLAGPSLYGLTSSGRLVYAYRDVIDCIIMVATTPRYGPFVRSHTAFVAAMRVRVCVCVR